MKSPKNIVLTGASGGLGKALVSRLAAPDRTFLLFGRNSELLEEACALAASKGSRAVSSNTPLEIHDKVARVIVEFDANAPIDLFIANAGVKCGNVDGIEPEEQLKRVVDVNLTSTLLSVQCVLPMMLDRGKGQIAFVSSLAGRSPQGSLLSYSASKAAIDAYATALRRNCHARGIEVSLIRAGFIDTPMTDRQIGPTPFKLSSRAAADRICRALERGQPVITLPRRLAFFVECERFLPTRLADLASKRLDAEIEPDTDERAASAHRLDTGNPE